MNAPSLFAPDDPGLCSREIDRPIDAATVYDDHLKLTLLAFDTVQAGDYLFGFIQCGNNDRNFHESQE